MGQENSVANEKERLGYIDFAKAIAIFLVLMGHTVDSDNLYKIIIYSFHMPLFFILSGMVNKYRNNYSLTSWKSFMQKRIIALYFPYILWACIYAKFSFKNLLFILWGTRETLIEAGSLTSLWFLPVLLVASILVEGVHAVTIWISMNKMFSAFSFIILFFLIGFLVPHYQRYGDPFGLDIAFVAAAFMLLGEVIMRVFSIDIFKKPLFLKLCCITSLVCMVLFFALFTPDRYVLMANAEYGSPLVFLFTSFAGSVFVLSLSKLAWLERNLLSYIGRNTMAIFILHKPVVEVLQKIVTSYGGNYNNIVFLLLIPAITICVILPVIYLMQTYVPFMFGRFNIERKAVV